uniref:Thioredoxin domain containing 8 n=1 Tax=Pongo abelii TaxID=9601 RepID=A0A8I5T2W5_PONAB
MVQIIKDMNEFKTFLTAAGHKLAVVEFSSKQCGPCKRMVPVFHELAETCHIKTIPTFQMFKKSQKGSIFRPTPTSELHPHQKWTLDSSQANPSQTRANCKTLLKQLGNPILKNQKKNLLLQKWIHEQPDF